MRVVFQQVEISKRVERVIDPRTIRKVNKTQESAVQRQAESKIMANSTEEVMNVLFLFCTHSIKHSSHCACFYNSRRRIYWLARLRLNIKSVSLTTTTTIISRECDEWKCVMPQSRGSSLFVTCTQPTSNTTHTRAHTAALYSVLSVLSEHCISSVIVSISFFT